MATPAPKLATYADLMALPEDVRAEVLAGEVVASPSPSPRHATVQRTVSRFVGGPFHDDDGRGGPRRLVDPRRSRRGARPPRHRAPRPFLLAPQALAAARCDAPDRCDGIPQPCALA